MGSLVLSRDEIKELTGCAQRALQRQHLTAMGIDYLVDANGWPKVDRRVYEAAMGLKEAANDDRHGEATINLEAFKP